MGLIKRKTSKAVERRKARDEEEPEKNKHHKVLTAEGWKRLMLGRSRKGSKTKH